MSAENREKIRQAADATIDTINEAGFLTPAGGDAVKAFGLLLIAAALVEVAEAIEKAGPR